MTVNILGEYAETIKSNSKYHAYHANGITAIEVGKMSKREARSTVNALINRMGINSKVLFVFE